MFNRNYYFPFNPFGGNRIPTPPISPQFSYPAQQAPIVAKDHAEEEPKPVVDSVQKTKADEIDKQVATKEPKVANPVAIRDEPMVEVIKEDRKVENLEPIQKISELDEPEIYDSDIADGEVDDLGIDESPDINLAKAEYTVLEPEKDSSILSWFHKLGGK
jgi:hypothetical protein